MDYRQFMNLLERGDLSGKENINSLQEFVNEFPYFQSAQSLLAKAMHEQQHVRYERQLKIASAHAGDRKLLYNLIHPKNERSLSDQPIIKDSPFLALPPDEIKENESVFIDTKTISVIPPAEDENPVSSSTIKEVTDDSVPVFFSEDYENTNDETEKEESVISDPHDIIRQRLVEILGLKEEKNENQKPVSESEKTSEVIIEKSHEDKIVVQETTTTPVIFNESRKDIIEVIADKSTNAVDFIERAELEYALEASIIQSLEKLPVIEKPLKKSEAENSEKDKTEFTFYDWLKSKAGQGFGKIEEVHADEVALPVQKEETDVIPDKDKVVEKIEIVKSKEEATRLIDQFIQTDPKIVPSKSEFYSPANQAKKSIMEDEDLVSETLAKIYHQQGNLLKARSCYQKLSLLFPEKLTYFAALISEIDQAINNLNKQDL